MATKARPILGRRVHYIGRRRDYGTIEAVRGGFYLVRWDRPAGGPQLDWFDPDVIVLLDRTDPAWDWVLAR